MTTALNLLEVAALNLQSVAFIPSRVFSQIPATPNNLQGGDVQSLNSGADVTFTLGSVAQMIIADVTVEEEHSDELEITQHPVETGAAITDHAYKRPARVTIRAGWSASSLAAGLDPGYPAALYAKLIKLQASRKVFQVVTGKRMYSNMLMASLGVTTDQATENVLSVTATMQEVIIVQTQTTSVPPAAVQANPSATAPVVNSGTKQAVAASAGPPS